MEGKFLECMCISGDTLYICSTYVDAQEGELIECAVNGCKLLGMNTNDKKKWFSSGTSPKKWEQENGMAAFMN